MRIISWVIALIVTVAAVLFAISNREIVQIAFWPLDGTLAVELFIPVLLAALVGFLAGGVVSWISAAPSRRLSRQRKRRIDELERRIALMEQRERARTEAAAAAAATSVDPAAEPPRQIVAVRA